MCHEIDVYLAARSYFGQVFADIRCERGEEALYGVGSHGSANKVFTGNPCQGMTSHSA